MEETNSIIIRTTKADGSIAIQTFPAMDAEALADHNSVKSLVTAFRKVVTGTALDYYVVNSKKYSDA